MKTLLNIFRKKPMRLQVVRREESKLRMAEWQNDPALCAMAAKVLADGNLQLMLSVLRNEHPAKHALPLGASPTDRMVQQARTEGYEMFLSNLEALARNTTLTPMPEALFEPEFNER